MQYGTKDWYLDNQLRKKERTFREFEVLYDKKLIALREFEEAEAEYEYLKAKLELTQKSQEQDSVFRAAEIEQLETSLQRMDMNLRLVKENQENLDLTAPISGLLTSLNAEIRESKSQGERLGQVDVLDGFKVRAGIDEHYIARINPGQRGVFTFSGQDFHLSIKKVYPEVKDGRFEVDLEFEASPPEGIRRGQRRLRRGRREHADPAPHALPCRRHRWPGDERAPRQSPIILNDMSIFAPGRLLDPAIRWRELDARSVEATYTNGPHTVRAVLVFDDTGALVDFWSDDRPALAEDGKTTLPQRWSTPIRDYRAMGPYKLATSGEGRYAAPEGEYAYIELEVNEVSTEVVSYNGGSR